MDLPIRQILLVVIVLFLGICIGLVIQDIPHFSLKGEVSMVELTNFILTLFVAIFVPFYLDRKLSNKRVEKDILIKSCESICTDLECLIADLKKLFVNQTVLTKEDATSIILITRKISNSLHNLDQECKKYKNNKDITTSIETLKENSHTYWEDLTVQLRETNPKISGERYTTAERNIYEYEANLQKLRLHLNNA